MGNLWNLKIQIPETGKYDVMALGALVHRLDSGTTPIEYATEFKVHVSGAEYNLVANACRYGMKTAVLTGIANYCIGNLIRNHVRAVGVDILGETLPHTPFDGNQAAVYSFAPGGCAVNEVDYNRAGEAALKIKPGRLKYDEIFKGGVRWVHSGGLYAALGEHAPDLIIEFFQAAKERGAVISFDLNYRGKLWEYHGGQKKAIEAMTKIVKYVDVLFSNETDMMNALGLSSSVEAESPVDPKLFKDVQAKARDKFPNLEIIVTSLRDELNNREHMWGAVASIGGEIYQSPAEKIAVEDRIGGGDGLAGGFVTAVLKGLPQQEALDAGRASGALVASVHGDITQSTWQHVLKVAKKGAKKVER